MVRVKESEKDLELKHKPEHIDELLAEYPTDEKVLNNIHILIERFKD